MLKRKILLTLSGIVFFAFFNAGSIFASTLYLSPGNGMIGQGMTKYVQVRLNAGGDAVNGVSAYLSYPADKLDVVSLSYGGAFSIAAEGSYGGGSIRVSRGNVGGVTGDVLIAIIGFRGKTLGPATVSFVGGSAAPRASDSSDSLAGRSGGTYSVVEASQIPTPTPAKMPEITNLTASDVTTNSATISWTTDTRTSTEIEYGLDQGKYILSVSDPKLNTDHSINIEGPLIVPGLKIHYRIVTTDSAGNEVYGKDNVLQFKGYTVKFVILDKSGKPLANTKVTIYSDPINAVTNANGEVTFNNLTPGKHLLVVKANTNESTQEVNVADSANVNQPQNFTVKVEGTSTMVMPVMNSTIFGAVGLVFIVIALIFLTLIYKKKRQTPSNNSFGSKDNHDNKKQQIEHKTVNKEDFVKKENTIPSNFNSQNNHPIQDFNKANVVNNSASSFPEHSVAWDNPGENINKTKENNDIHPAIENVAVVEKPQSNLTLPHEEESFPR